MTTRQEAAAAALTTRREEICARGLELAPKMGVRGVRSVQAEVVLAAADARDREAGIYRIKLDDDLGLHLLGAVSRREMTAPAERPLLTDVLLSVLRERAEQ